MRCSEFLPESVLSAHLNAIKDFGVRPDEKLARLVAQRDFIATAKFLALARRRWVKQLIAAGLTHPPIPAYRPPLAAPPKPSESAARYTSSGMVAKPTQAP